MFVASEFIKYCWYRDNAPRFSKVIPSFEELRLKAMQEGVLNTLYWGVVMKDNKPYSLMDDLATWFHKEKEMAKTDQKKQKTSTTAQWLKDFKAEFLRRTGITWEEGAGMEDQDALDRYYPEDVAESVQHHMDKYDLFDINEDFK